MPANTPIPLPRGNNGLSASPKTQERIKNLFLTSGENPVLSIRPGVDDIQAGFGKCRGMGLFRNDVTGDEELYMISGSQLIRVTITNQQARKILTAADVLIEDLGFVSGSGEVVLVGGFTQLAVIEVGGFGYTFDNSAGLVQITDPNFEPANNVVYDQGRFVYSASSGDYFFWSDLDEPGIIDVLSFADSEQFPDPLRVVYAQKRSIYGLGSRSTQRFDYNPTLDTYVPRKGEESTVGYVGGLTSFGETFAFIGNGSDGDFNIYAMFGQPQAISNDFISELINNEYSQPELVNVVGESFEWKGTTILIFRLPRHTLAYYGHGWAFWQTGITGHDVAQWRIAHLESAYGFTWTGDFNNEVIGVLRDSGEEYGNDIEWAVKTFITSTPESNFIIKRLTVRATMGLSLGDRLPRVSLGVCQDGRLPGKQKYKNLGRTGDYNAQLRWGSPVIKAYDSVSIFLIGYGNRPMNLDGVFFE